MADRTIILHYHLFKNAGTSFDRILKNNFLNRWETAEFPAKGGNNSDLVAHWIRSKPEAVAFSSHTMLGPIPQINGVRVISVLFLRDPVERIHSAYQFERRQELDTFGPILARATSFEGYVRVRLALPQDRQCRNFQTFRLASMQPGDTPNLDRAISALPGVSVLGLVERFGDSLDRFRAYVSDVFPEFAVDTVHLNASADAKPVPAPGGPEFRKMLEEVNQDDIALLDHARSFVTGLGPAFQTQT